MHSCKKIRYALVGAGHIAQAAVLPAFRHAKNSELGALVSGDLAKLRILGRRLKVPTYHYDDLEQAARDQNLDAAYIALPNHLHCAFTLRAARCGLHVLCEKPLATTVSECREMIKACYRADVKLMTAYRLHFDEAHLQAIRLIDGGKIGEPRYFDSLFSMQVASPNIRLQRYTGGGTVLDLGIYCINAARYLYRDEPIGVFAHEVRHTQGRFREVDEMTAVTLRFAGGRLATFTCSFGADPQSRFTLTGSKGSLEMRNAYEYVSEQELHWMSDLKQKRLFTYKKKDQFAPELIYFSDCILHERDIEPDGDEGMRDLRVIEAIRESIARGTMVRLPRLERKTLRPKPEQAMRVPPVPHEAKLVHARSASGS